ncbi:MAG: peptidoglycan recognition family protein [Comamonadaceae bacterium]|jgi:hypothetical protein
MSSRRQFLALCALLNAGCGSAPLTKLATDDGVISVQTWGGNSTPAALTPQRITHITVHHQGELWDPESDVAAYLVRLQKWSRATKGWIDIPYHYIIAPDGLIYAARPWEISGDTQTEYDPRGHLLVMLLGNFEIQYPTPKQWDSTVGLIAQLQRRFGLEANQIGTHRDYSTQTVCPGAHLFERFQELKEAVKDRLN